MSNKHTMEQLKITGVAIPVQFNACTELMRQHVNAKGSAKLALPIQPDAFENGRLEWDTKMNDFTKADIHRGLAAIVKLGQELKIPNANGLPTAGKAVGSKAILSSYHTPTRGKNIGKRFFNILIVWQKIKQAEKANANRQALEGAKKLNMQIYVDTVTLKDGSHRAFTDIKKAMGAYCRQNFGSEWFNSPNKLAYQSEAMAAIMPADDPRVVHPQE